MKMFKKIITIIILLVAIASLYLDAFRYRKTMIANDNRPQVTIPDEVVYKEKYQSVIQVNEHYYIYIENYEGVYLCYVKDELTKKDNKIKFYEFFDKYVEKLFGCYSKIYFDDDNVYLYKDCIRNDEYNYCVFNLDNESIKYTNDLDIDLSSCKCFDGIKESSKVVYVKTMIKNAGSDEYIDIYDMLPTIRFINGDTIIHEDDSYDEIYITNMADSLFDALNDRECYLEFIEYSKKCDEIEIFAYCPETKEYEYYMFKDGKVINRFKKTGIDIPISAFSIDVDHYWYLDF